MLSRGSTAIDVSTHSRSLPGSVPTHHGGMVSPPPASDHSPTLVSGNLMTSLIAWNVVNGDVENGSITPPKRSGLSLSVSSQSVGGALSGVVPTTSAG